MLTQIKNEQIQRKFIQSFKFPKVNYNKLSAVLGVNVTTDNFNFDNILKANIASSEGTAYILNCKSNSNLNVGNYALVLYQDANGYILESPVLIKARQNEVTYFDMNGAIISQIEIENVSPNGISTEAKVGQGAMNCFIDAYSNHGWKSLWASVQSAFIPATAAAIAAICIIHNPPKLKFDPKELDPLDGLNP